MGVDGTAKVWDAFTGQELLTLPGEPGDYGYVVAFSPDGKLLATALSTKVIVWDAATGQELLTLSQSGVLHSVAFSPDGTRLATTSWDGVAKVWDVSEFTLSKAEGLNTGLASGREVVTFTGHLNQGGEGTLLGDVAFSPDGKHVFTGGSDGYVREWDSTTGQELRTFSGEGLEVWGIALSHDGKLLAMGRQDGVVTVWDVSSGKKLLQLSGHAGLILRLVFSEDETRLASASFDGFAKVWDVKTGRELVTLYGNTSNVFGVAFSPDGTRLATAGGDGTSRIYTLQMEDLVRLARSRVTRSLTTEECRKYLHVETCPATP